MQTFLPYSDFTKCAESLDNKRLGKQRVEVLQILNAIAGLTDGWRNHPASNMWRKHTDILALYGMEMCDIWTRKGFKDTCKEKIAAIATRIRTPTSDSIPAWLGDERLHSSHRANLLRKDQVFYSKFGWTEDPTTPYFWPL